MMPTNSRSNDFKFNFINCCLIFVIGCRFQFDWVGVIFRLKYDLFLAEKTTLINPKINCSNISFPCNPWIPTLIDSSLRVCPYICQPVPNSFCFNLPTRNTSWSKYDCSCCRLDLVGLGLFNQPCDCVSDCWGYVCISC